MANVFLNLPAPAADGAGAWVDTSGMGSLRSVTSVGNGSGQEPFVTIEFSNNSSPTDGVPLITFFQPGDQSFGVSAMWMRAVVSNYQGGGAPTVNVGSTDDGVTSLQLVAPANNGSGAGVDVSALASYKTIQVQGAFKGQVNLLVSEDGGATYNEAFSFQQPGGQSALFAADFMKVLRVGIPATGGGDLPVIWIGAALPPGGGGGGGGGGAVVVKENGTTVVAAATTLNFTNTGVTVTDSGGGVAAIDIPGGGGGGGVNVLDADSTIVAGASGIRFLGAPVAVTVDGVDPTIADVTVTVPSAASFTITLPTDVGNGFVPGQVGYQDPALSHRFSPSINNDTETDAQCLGMCTQAQVGATQVVCVGGIVTLTAPEWAAVIFEGGALVEGPYYVADNNGALVGMITAIKPTTSGHYITVVGYAMRRNGDSSTLDFVVRPSPPALIP